MKTIKGMMSLMALLVGAMLLFVDGAFASAGVNTGMVRSSMQMPYGQMVQMNGINVEIWVNYIMENLFKDNDFLNYCFDEGDFVLGGAVVHIPQAGAKPTVVKNRSGAGTIVQRTDTDITYPLDAFTTDPVLIQNVEAVEVSYDKIASVLSEQLEALREVVGDNMIYNWLVNGVAAGAIVRTTGAASGVYLAPGATGTRLLFVKENLKSAQFIMNKQNIPKTDRFALLPSEFIDILNSDADLIKRDANFGGELSLKDGKVSMLYGFKIIDRSDVAVFDNSGTPVVKAPGAATATTDNLAGICWQRNAIAKAMGTVDFFFRENDPVNYGDIYSALVRMGGRARRTALTGIVPIVQA